MKKQLMTAVLATTFISGLAFASDPVIPWGTNSGGTESSHIADAGQDLNTQHQATTKTQEGVWATNSGSIGDDEAALSSTKPPVAGHPELMPHQG